RCGETWFVHRSAEGATHSHCGDTGLRGSHRPASCLPECPFVAGLPRASMQDAPASPAPGTASGRRPVDSRNRLVPMHLPRSALGAAAPPLPLPAPAMPADAQQEAARPSVAPSGRVTTSVACDGRLLRTRGDDWGWFTNTPAHSGPSRMIIDYGQPHARGRTIFGDLVPYGQVWRLGANWATTLML